MTKALQNSRHSYLLAGDWIDLRSAALRGASRSEVDTQEVGCVFQLACTAAPVVDELVSVVALLSRVQYAVRAV